MNCAPGLTGVLIWALAVGALCGTTWLVLSSVLARKTEHAAVTAEE